MRLAESERKVMEQLWENGEMTAKELAAALNQKIGWSKTTTYTMLTRCAEKGYLSRREPNFRCTAILTKEEVAHSETDTLIDNNYSGSPDLLVAALIARKKLSGKQIAALREALDAMEDNA